MTTEEKELFSILGLVYPNYEPVIPHDEDEGSNVQSTDPSSTSHSVQNDLHQGISQYKTYPSERHKISTSVETMHKPKKLPKHRLMHFKTYNFPSIFHIINYLTILIIINELRLQPIILSQASQIELRLPSRLTNLTASANSRELEDISYLVEYEPSRGIPSSRFKLTPSDIKTNANVIIADTAPGTNYTINVFPIFANETMGPLIWSTIYSTEPGPPRELSVDVITGKEVKLDWSPPIEGAVSDYQAKIIPLSEHDEAEVKNLTVTHTELTLKLRDLTPGATYEVQLQSIYGRKPSNVFLSANFTTKPNTPGRFIVWFRNETTLLVLWNPPFPSGIFDKYRVNILPPDSGLQSELEIDREEGSKSAQAAFYGLVPGRNYNISVQTVSHDQYSQPVEAQYRTVPLPPSNITQDKSIVSSNFIEVRWSPPKHTTEFDRYQLSLGTIKSSGPKIVPKDEERVARFDENLEPGRTYEVVVKTVSGNVASWPISSNITTAPLPVTDIKSTHGKAGEIFLEWTPNNQSIQDSYIIKYHEVEAFNSDGTVQVVQGKNSTQLVNLLAGRNFSITVFAVSHDVSSEPTVTFGITRPATPIVESKQIQQGGERALNISWRWDVTSKQDSYRINLSRNDTRQRKEYITRDNSYILENLYPGATYNINVSAISFNLISEPYSFHQTINPRPPEKVEISRVTNSSLSLSWLASQNSIIDHYAVKYKAMDSHFWREVQPIESTFAELKDLEAGERYLIKVVSQSNKIESIESKEVEQTMYPNSITDIKHVLDSYNLTFQWSIPSGRVDYYIVVYNSIREPTMQQSKQISINNARTGQLVTAIIDFLVPGELYSFMFYAVSYNLRSEGIGIQLRTLPVIASSVQVVIDEHATKTLGIKYSPTLPRYVVFDRYRFQISEPSAPIQERLQNDTNRLVLFDNLTPGKLYNISVWTVSGGMFSAPITRQARLYPEPVRSISSVSVSDTEITLVWETPFGDNDAFEVQYLDHRDKHLRSNVTFAEKITFTNLRPHSNYTFIVTVLSGYGTSTVLRSSPTSQTFSTLESTPGKVKSFHAIDVKPHEITLRWSLPSSDQNGVLTGYKISYYYKSSSLLKNEYFPPIQSNGTITGLIPGKQYVFQIQAHTKVGGGSKALWEETMPIWAPPQPETNQIATENGHTSTTIRARFKKSFFSNIYGPVIAYTIIVSEDSSKTSDHLDLPSWFDVQPYATWPPYQTVEPFYPVNSSVVEEFVIGSANCFNGRSNDKLYCNGPLKSGTSYKVKVRAFTAHDKFTDTKWSSPMTTDADNTAMFVGILLPLSLLTLLVITILFMKQRQLGPFTKQGHKSNLKKSLASGTLNNAFKDDPISIDIREMNTSRPVELKNFGKHFREMSADSDFRFSEEFDQLKYIGTDKTVKAADIPANRPKNRFTNIVPYDHSRVKLSPTDDEEGSDYINANYIPGYNSPREFIVTQGPLYGTQDDFWRMLWEQNSRAIVMLTRCIEKGREKCIQYWPSDNHPVIYGDIQVIMLNECQYADWTVTELKVSRNDSSRIVRHFHFTTWPDFGVPEPPSTLVKFVRAFREKVHPTGNHPIIAHCSAGVGRSGTFIALDRILQIIRTKDVVDIFGIVCEMRRERCHMVQNEQQYICIHQCLMWALEGENDLTNGMIGGKRQPDLHSHGLIGLSAESGI